ncbi:hypothetical protein CEUSTIGMA_g8851.t1 [Chlamydomonas eustigma]|uniref:tRNA-5-taurinomethyluridine 2-sulfurtransferase n=1 Tax=Chlamydomonas eustigma TaxID=1157962 RepID=A0A250XEE4_9CHLO|nr:hypothetical protein CEUSTIGMA_g8851.t1 [Chlamydomonas eustigma]|eukprot:GAX81421.1 hypothetical protein CEUSTIGMA_g8851.t1 [Chlamydomonas eustigma]
MWEEDLSYAKEVCTKLGVELEVVPMTNEYWQHVVSHSVTEIREGRTPNPDMLCNSRVKFGAFYQYLEHKYGDQFDRIASGHYARVLRGGTSWDHWKEQQQRQMTSEMDGMTQPQVLGDQKESAVEAVLGEHQESVNAGVGSSYKCVSIGSHEGEIAHTSTNVYRDQQGTSNVGTAQQNEGDKHSAFHQDRRFSCTGISEQQPSDIVEDAPSTSSCSQVRLVMTPDAVKDQTYFLAHLSRKQLQKVMFPLGPLNKTQVRQLANIADLANKNRKDSQGICFLGKVKFHEFVHEHLGEWPGLLVEEETGTVIGSHAGYWFYTVGQRSGIKLPGGPWYVVRKDLDLNIVYASKQYHSEELSNQRNSFSTGPINWVSDLRIDLDKPVYCKVRHGPAIYRCKDLKLVPQLMNYNIVGSIDDVRPSSEMAMVPVTACVELESHDQGLAPGQYAVFYQDRACLGAAKIVS